MSPIECHSPCRGTGYYIERHDVYACPRCGDVAYADNVETTSSGKELLAGGDEEDFVRIVGEVVLDTKYVGPMAVVKAPYDASDAIKTLDFRETERQWSEEIDHWIVRTRYRDALVEAVEDAGFPAVDLVRIRREHS